MGTGCEGDCHVSAARRTFLVLTLSRLTKQFEGGLLKCGNYWDQSTYGSLRISLDSQTGGDDQRVAETPGFNFGSAFNDKTTQAAEEEQDNIHRTFTLRNSNGESRKVVQIQCTAWPDLDVPESPEVLLTLLRDVNVAVEGLCEGDQGRAYQPPVLVHCECGHSDFHQPPRALRVLVLMLS